MRNVAPEVAGSIPLTLARCLSSCGKRGDTLAFTLIFKNAKGLESGQKIVWRGVDVGRITDVALDSLRRGLDLEKGADAARDFWQGFRRMGEEPGTEAAPASA